MQLTPNIWISINDFYSVFLLAGVPPTAEFFLTSFLQRTQKDDFLYFMVKPHMKGFCEPLPSKLDPESWTPFVFFVSREGLSGYVPFGFTPHRKSTEALPGSIKHK
ncbi:hypothetical protein LIER_25208 [Lithospermum erythrorhizon]|uniref:Uncharacterized protein n=1 Tax=Lithospermum erythrorhizon TaxID=34254 RepID=A0AAV3R869_LITER